MSFILFYLFHPISSSSVIQKLAVDKLDISGEKAEANCEKLKAKAQALSWKIDLIDGICDTLDVVVLGNTNPAATACYAKSNALGAAWSLADGAAESCKLTMKTTRPWLKWVLLNLMYPSYYAIKAS